MTESFETTGRVTGGKLQLRNKAGMQAAVACFPDGEVVLRLERLKAKRSNQANRWYWGQILHLISEHTGYDPEDLHEYFKQRFLPKRLALADGNGEVKDDVVIGGSTTKLTTKEFAAYCERIRQFAAEELAVNIPDPSEAAA